MFGSTMRNGIVYRVAILPHVIVCQKMEVKRPLEIFRQFKLSMNCVVFPVVLVFRLSSFITLFTLLFPGRWLAEQSIQNSKFGRVPIFRLVACLILLSSRGTQEEERDSIVSEDKKNKMSLLSDNRSSSRNDNQKGTIFDRKSFSPGKYKLRPTDASNVSFVKQVTDEEQLYNVLETNGNLVDGISAMEVWILRDDDSTLAQPPGGFWRSPNFIPKDRNSFEKIYDNSRPDYVPPLPILLGTGLVGVLWNDDEPMKKGANMATFGFGLGKLTMASELKERSFQKSPLSKSFQSLTNLHSDFSHTSGGRLMSRTAVGEKVSTSTLRWRHIKSIIQDPYQPTFERVNLMEKSGLSKCAGIKFNVSGVQGILLLFTDMDVAQYYSHDSIDIDFVRAIANHVGSTVALLSCRPQRSIDKIQGNPMHKVMRNDKGGCCEWVSKYVKKLKGGNLEPPPPMSLNEGLLTFMGVLLTLLVLQEVSDWIEKITGYGIIMGPFGALMTLQYGLTMAPVGQPRNVLFGQIIATIVALSFSSVSKDWFHRNLRISLSTATAITAKVLLGIAHPPAGATALIVSSGEFNWNILLSVVLSNLIAIILSTLINNLSQKRQYPTYLKMGEGFIYNLAPITGFDFNRKCNSSDNGDDETVALGDLKSSLMITHSNYVESDQSIISYDDDYHRNVLFDEEHVLSKHMIPNSTDIYLGSGTSSITYNYGSMFITPLLLPGRSYEGKYENNPSSNCSSDLEDFPTQPETITSTV